MAALSTSAGLFEVSVPEYKQLKACCREMRLLKELWDMIALVHATACEAAGQGGESGNVQNRLLGCAGLWFVSS